VRALKENTDLLRTLQEEYLYILADEHQDANNSQNAILELLSDYSDTQNLFIVGDEKQAIYRFQGASLENFLYFQKKFPNAEVIFLDSNYRSTQNILDASHALMQTEGADVKLRLRLTASSRKKFDERPITLLSFATSEDEMEGIAEDIEETIKSGVPAEEIAVLVRTNAETSLVGRSLQGFSVPHTLFADDNVLKDSDIAKLLLLFRAVVHPEDDELLGGMLLIDFLGLHPIDAVKLNRTASEKRISPLDLLSRKNLLPALTDFSAVENLVSRFTGWMVRANNESALDSFIAIVSDTKFQEYLLGKQESIEKVEKLAKLYDEVKSFLTTHKDATLKDFMNSIDTLLRHSGVISFSRRTLGARGVAVMTAHKSKGLEWQRVYIVNAGDKVWGNRRGVGGFKLPAPLGGGEESEENEDERRLFYVALTRAKEHVTISYSSLDANGKDRLVSQFVEDLPEELLEKKEGKVFAGAGRLTRAQVEKKSDIRTIFDKEYLKEIFLDQGLNATALNNYIECPWKYFFKNLIRLPDASEPYLHFGNATHAALKALADAKREGKKFTEKDFLKVFEDDLHRRPISKRDLAETLKKGKRVLPIYFKERVTSWHTDAFTEYPIVGVFLSLPKDVHLLLRGRLDKVEILGGSAVNVVDYKTGGHKTRNDILGETKSSNGNIKRQLDFYRLLLELHDEGKYEMVSGTIDFVEPDEKGKIHREVFQMSHEDAEKVKKETLKTAEEIIDFAFWDKECDDPKCEFCALKETLFGE
jgi:DNA helicase-2/ATP-dependent DNA helicase PcrA